MTRHGELNIARTSTKDLRGHRAILLRRVEMIEAELARRGEEPGRAISEIAPACELAIVRRHRSEGASAA
jgi:hypothetical protein